MRRLGVTPHVTQNTKGRRSAIDGRTTRHPGYAVSLRGRKRIGHLAKALTCQNRAFRAFWPCRPLKIA
jgi:hypothetical protein